MNTTQSLTEQMADKSDRQLLDIFARPSDWSSEALDAARTELHKRGIAVPEPQPPPAPPSEAEKRKAMLKRNGWIMLAIFFAAAFINGSKLVTGLVVDVFQTGCLAGVIIFFVAAARVKKGK